MSDWDFLYEMNYRSYSPDEIADALDLVLHLESGRI
jgi:hypothetical protein